VLSSVLVARERRRLLRADAGEERVGMAMRQSPFGFVDEVLARQVRSRRIALTVPNFMFALAVIAETDLITALRNRR
jgi:hypothetical protein